jgi:CheY-like chemotaxis protein
MAVVLFVDDEPDTLMTLKKAVELFGHQANLAYSGKDALQKVGEINPNLIFLDMNLADMNGLELLRALRANPQTAHLPAIVLSAGPELDAAEHAQAAGAQAYMLKPVRLQALLDAIHQYAPAT